MVKPPKRALEPPRVGREYLRVSNDPEKELRSPDEQHTENAEAVSALGIRLGEAYREPEAVSASRYAKKAREEYLRLVGDINGGRFGADVLVLWESSRGSRQTGEWVALLDALERNWIRVYVTTHERLYAPWNHRDRKTLLEDAIDSEYASAETSIRVSRNMKHAAAKGRPHAHVPYGYRRRYDDRSGKLIGQDAYEPEAAVVRELFERLAKGHTLSAIMHSLTERGIMRRDGGPFGIVHLREMALRAAYAGFRVHNAGQGRSRGHWNATAVKTDFWPALVDEETFHAVGKMLRDPGRRDRRPGAGRYLMSGNAVCDRFDCPLGVSFRPDNRWRYRCSHARIDMDVLDKHVEGIMLDWLARKDVYERWHRGDTSEDLARVRVELARAQAEYEAADPDRNPPADLEEARAVAAMRRRLKQTIESLGERERELAVPPVIKDLMGPDARRKWKASPMSTRREAARLLLVPEQLGQVRLLSWPKGVWVGRTIPVDERVVWRTVDSEAEPELAEHQAQ